MWHNTSQVTSEARLVRIFGHTLGQTRAAVPPDRDETEVPAMDLPMCGRSFFRQIVERARCALLVIEALSLDHTIVYASPAIEDLTGYAPEEFIGQDWRQFLIQSGAQSPADPMEGATYEGFMMRHKDGAELCLDVKLSQFGVDPAFVTHYIAVLHRLTAERRAREVLEYRACRDPLADAGEPCQSGVLAKMTPTLRREGQRLAAPGEHQNLGAGNRVGIRHATNRLDRNTECLGQLADAK